ncbi:MAG: hypothetical protein PVH84_14455 [Candidatus Aminicenantes bacterium]|jgi:predicted TIM-barrel fold metal-dependent hydrolase
MTNTDSDPNAITDMHFHVGVLGDEDSTMGKLTAEFRQRIEYKVFLLYARLKEGDVSDQKLWEAVKETIESCNLDHVVCLALDPVYDHSGNRREDKSLMWVANDYVIKLRDEMGDKVLLGASVHPYDPSFEARVNDLVAKDAALIKWLPSAQQIDLADEKVRDALVFLAGARNGDPLPVLLHVGPEYAIPSSDPRTTSYDFLSWTVWDKIGNFFRGANKWHTPQVEKIHTNLRAGLDKGAIIIFAHCGLPYYAPHWLRRIFEHSDFKSVRRYIEEYPADGTEARRCYTDLSACVTPFRRSYFPDIGELPPDSLLFGSDFPTPVFELSANVGELMDDLKSVFKGNLERIVVPQDNLLDVNLRELRHFFPEHPMFTNFNRLRNI